MPRKIRITLRGRKEEIWFTDNGGLMGAYDLAEWYQNLPKKIQDSLLELQSSLSNSTMPEWDRTKIIEGEYEIHRPIIEKLAWTYSSVPDLLSTIFHWGMSRDLDIAQIVLDEWLTRVKKVKSPGAKYLAYGAAIEFYWKLGYTGAKSVRTQGLHNDELKLVKKYAELVIGLLKKQQIPNDINGCKPLDRLFLLYKLTGKKDTGLVLIDELEESGYAQLFEVKTYKTSFLNKLTTAQ